MSVYISSSICTECWCPTDLSTFENCKSLNLFCSNSHWHVSASTGSCQLNTNRLCCMYVWHNIHCWICIPTDKTLYLRCLIYSTPKKLQFTLVPKYEINKIPSFPLSTLIRVVLIHECNQHGIASWSHAIDRVQLIGVTP